MAIESGIPPSTWAAEGDRVVTTALELLRERAAEQDKRKGSTAKTDGGGRQLSG